MQYRAIVEAIGLPVASIYSAGSFIYPEKAAAESAAMEGTARFLASLGSKTMVVGGGHKRLEGNSREDYENMARVLNRIGSAANKLGLHLCFHPHSGTCVDTPQHVDLLMDLTDPTFVHLCPDTGHLLRGGAEPAAFIKKYLPRVGYVHLKDLASDDRFIELGQGLVDVAAVVRLLREGGYQGWLTVELDSTSRTPRESAALNLAYLRGLGLGE